MGKAIEMALDASAATKSQDASDGERFLRG